MFRNDSFREWVNLNGSLLNYNEGLNYMPMNDYRSFSSGTSPRMNSSNDQGLSVNQSGTT